MLTIDHIVPKSVGGRKKAAANQQLMCHGCNNKKSNKIELATLENVWNNIEDYIVLNRLHVFLHKVITTFPEFVIKQTINVAD